MSAQRSAVGSAFLWGSILGSAVVLLDVVDHFVLGGVQNLGPAVVAVLRRRHVVVVRPVTPVRILLVEGLVLLIILLLYFLAGALAARQANSTSAGIGAGVIAGAIVAIAHMVIVIVTLLLATHPAVIAGIVRGLVVALLALVLAIAAAAVGALFGRGSDVSSGGAQVAAPSAPPAPTAVGYVAGSPTLRTPVLDPHTPTPLHYGPENDYPTAPIQSSSSD